MKNISSVFHTKVQHLLLEVQPKELMVQPSKNTILDVEN